MAVLQMLISFARQMYLKRDSEYACSWLIVSLGELGDGERSNGVAESFSSHCNYLSLTTLGIGPTV